MMAMKRCDIAVSRALAGDDIPAVASDLGITTQAIYDLLRRRGISVSELRQRHPLRKCRTTVQLAPEALQVIDEGVAPTEHSRSSRVSRILERLDLMYWSTINHVLASLSPADLKTLTDRMRNGAGARLKELAGQDPDAPLATRLRSLSTIETAVLEEYLDRAIHQQ